MRHTLIGRLAQRLTGRLLPALALFVYGTLLPVHAASFPVQAWTYATVGLSMDQPPAATSRRIPAAAAATETMAAPAGPLTATLPELSNPTDDAQASSLLEQISGYMHNRMAQSLTPDGVAQTLRSFSNAGAGHLAGDIAQSFIDQGTGRLADELRNNFFRTLNLSWRPGYGGREEVVQIDTVMSLLDGDSNSLFGQAGLQSRDGEGGLHAGLGYRVEPVAGILLGANAFYDYLSDPEVSRYSLGLEVRSPLMDLSGNWYQGLSDETLSDGRIAYSPDGFDVEFAAHMPYMPYLEVTGRYYRWEGEGADPDDLNGTEYGLRFFPVPLFTLKTVYDNISGGGNDVGVEALIQYEFGVPLSQQLQLERVAFRTDMWQRRFERVQRQYEQRVRYRGAVASRSNLVLNVAATSNGLTLTWPRSSAAGSARISWRQAGSVTQNGVQSADGGAAPAPLVENDEVTLNLTDAICPPSGTMCTYTIAGLQPGTQYAVTLDIYSGAGATGTRLSSTSEVATTTGTRPNTTIGVTASVTGTTEGGAAVTITLSATPAPNARGGVSVPYTISGTGITAEDYTLTDAAGNAVTSPVNMPIGETTLALTLTALRDSDTTESLEMLTWQLDAPAANAGYVLDGSRSAVTISISPPASAAFSTDTTSVSEDGGTVTLTIAVTADPSAAVAVPIIIIDGTAMMGSDYTVSLAENPIRVAAGETTATVSIGIVDDTDDEVDETFTVALGSSVAGSAVNSVEVTILRDLNDIPSVRFASDLVNVREDATVAELRVMLDKAPATELTIPIDITATSATTGVGPASDDFKVIAQGVKFQAGTADLMRIMQVTILDDSRMEGNEQFTATFGTLPAAVVAAGTPATVTVDIADDDQPVLTFLVGSLSVAEDKGTLSVPISLSATPSSTVATTVTVASGGTATQNTDYAIAGSGTVYFFSGYSGNLLTQFVEVGINEDKDYEEDETFTLAFTTPSGYSSNLNRMQITIVDNDPPPLSVSASPAVITEGEASTITIALPSADPVGSAGALCHNRGGRDGGRLHADRRRWPRGEYTGDAEQRQHVVVSGADGGR